MDIFQNCTICILSIYDSRYGTTQAPLADSLQDLKLQINDSIVINESKSGKFGRTLDAMPATLLNNNQPLNGNISMEIHSADEDKSKTPKSYVRFYGVAAMYKKVNVELNQPSAQEYYIGNEKINALPMQVELNSGAQSPEVKRVISGPIRMRTTAISYLQ